MAETIPTELIERALAFAASIDLPTARAVCLTNKLGRRAGTPVLYHTIDISGHYQDGLVDVRLRRLSLLSRTLLNSKTLPIHVRCIKVYLDDLEDLTYLAPPPPDLVALRKLLKEGLAVSDEQKRDLKNWLDFIVQDVEEAAYDQYELEGGDEEDEDGLVNNGGLEDFCVYGPEFFVSILTLACSNLRLLDISGCANHMEPITGLNHALAPARLQGTVDRPDGLGKLKEVHLSTTGDAEDWDVQTAGQALRWPSIEKMTIDELHGGTRIEPNLGYPTFQSTLKMLDVKDAIINEMDLEPLLKVCPQLTSFSMKWNEHFDVYRSPDWPALARILAESNPLLEELRLDIAPFEDLREVCLERTFEVNNEGLGDLNDFKHLRKLFVPYFALFGVFDNPQERRGQTLTLAQLIPTSLEELEVVCEGVDFSEDDKAVLNAPDTSRLRDLTIWNCTRDKWISRARGEGQCA